MIGHLFSVFYLPHHTPADPLTSIPDKTRGPINLLGPASVIRAGLIDGPHAGPHQVVQGKLLLLLLLSYEEEAAQGQLEDEEDHGGDDGPDVDEAEDEGVGGESEEDVAEVEGEEAEEEMLADLGLGEAVHGGRGHGEHVEVEHGLDDGEEGEEHGEHGNGGQTGDPSQGVLHTGGGQRLVPGQGEDPSQHQPHHQDELQRRLYAPHQGLDLGRLLLQLKELQLVPVAGEASFHHQNPNVHEGGQQREEYHRGYDHQCGPQLVLLLTVPRDLPEADDVYGEG